jgi:perosamine synthetase
MQIVKGRKMIPVLRPVGAREELRGLKEVISSGWWGRGPRVEELEDKFSKMVKCRYAVAVNSCTAALHAALEALDVHRKEVIVPTITFIAPAMVPFYCDDRTVLADVKESDYCIDPDRLPLSKKTGAIIAVDEAGALADIDAIKGRFKGPIIEDCAHACYVEGAGAKSDISCWSFQAVKTLPAGDGGMVTTNSKKVAEKVKRISWNGIGRSTWDRAQGKRYTWNYKIYGLGWKYYMNDITAAIALAQLKKLGGNLKRRTEIAKLYEKGLKGYVIPPPKSGTYQYYVIRVRNRDKIADYLANRGIATSVHFKPLHLYGLFSYCAKASFPVANRIWKEFLTLPMHVALSNDDVRYIIRRTKEAVLKFNMG